LAVAPHSRQPFREPALSGAHEHGQEGGDRRITKAVSIEREVTAARISAIWSSEMISL
jgi:hypothetical protein